MDPNAGKRVFRIQDQDGRGPFRPGFSEKWLDGIRSYEFMSWYEEFGWQVLQECQQSGLHCGSACRTLDQLHNWFSRSERRRLKKHGYDVVTFVPDRIFAESDIQLVFGMKEPLARQLILP